jgi:hypothetical protein
MNNNIIGITVLHNSVNLYQESIALLSNMNFYILMNEK